jgi:hypothetical protein
MDKFGDETRWIKSTRSGANGNCVEVALGTDLVGVRDTKDRSGPVLMFTAEQWAEFTRAAKAGEFDRPV